jgi:hypothetical protein
MSSKERDGEGGGGFSDFEGSLELDQPSPAIRPSPAPAPPPLAGPGARRGPLPERPAVQVDLSRYHALMPEKRSGRGTGVIVRVVLLGLLGGAGYGAYHGYCVYKVGEKEHAFSALAQELRQTLLRITDANRPVRPADLRAAVLEYASGSGVLARPEEIRVSIEPLGEESVKKLPSMVRMAMGIAAKIPKHERPPWVVGFEASLVAAHGSARQRFEIKRYTYMETAEP